MEHLPLGRRIHADRRGHGTGLDGENATLRLGERTLTVAGSVVPHPQAPEPGSIFCPGRNSEDRTRVPSTRTPTVHLPGSQASNPRSAGVKCRGSTSPAGICIASSSSMQATKTRLTRALVPIFSLCVLIFQHNMNRMESGNKASNAGDIMPLCVSTISRTRFTRRHGAADPTMLKAAATRVKGLHGRPRGVMGRAAMSYRDEIMHERRRLRMPGRAGHLATSRRQRILARRDRRIDYPNDNKARPDPASLNSADAFRTLVLPVLSSKRHRTVEQDKDKAMLSIRALLDATMSRHWSGGAQRLGQDCPLPPLPLLVSQLSGLSSTYWSDCVGPVGGVVTRRRTWCALKRFAKVRKPTVCGIGYDMGFSLTTWENVKTSVLVSGRREESMAGAGRGTHIGSPAIEGPTLSGAGPFLRLIGYCRRRGCEALGVYIDAEYSHFPLEKVRVAGVRVVSLRDQDLSAAPPVRTRSREVISARRRGAKSVRSGGVPRGTTVLLLDAAYVSTALLLGPGDFMPTKGRPTIGRVVAALSLVAYGIALQHRLGRAEYVETESMVGA
ncbi:hypothetical protein PCL_05111 [Purpureocillium lilacinum]|uniref:Uncharacterized protein n=1 Tax=Purpureocillium lilacinum TaxID=33203 RepID=A0A2U3DVX9_PURLI|nr:hypothetical protein PCL_05111 [Purpureocillium lilacinum]